MAKKVGTLIKEARTDAGLSQEQLARKIKGLSAAELGKAERGETELTQAFLKEIAKATGVTQASLLNAAKGSAAAAKKTETVKKTATAKKTETAKKTTAAKKTETAKKTTAKKTTAKKTDTELTAAEKKLLEAYREASADAKKNALKLLKGEDLEFADIMKLLKLDSKLDSLGSGDGILGGLKEGLLGGILGKK
ncbi:MAG: helix-turn-helix transcriptional regulator [Oscillospiraceae bacterium]|nr:helix-turn-helix transcriptional regulator [Oscillospiraceae bacterium]